MNAAQRKPSEDGAGLFAAMLQDIPADGTAQTEPNDAAATNTFAAASATAENLAGTAELPDPAIAAGGTAFASTLAADAEADSNAETAAAPLTDAPESVQFFEGQRALRDRMAAFRAEGSTTPQTETRSNDMPAATRNTAPASELHETTSAKGRKQAATDNDASLVAADQPATSTTEKTTSTDLLTLPGRPAEGDGRNQDNEDKMPPQPMTAIIADDTAAGTSATAARSANTRGDGRATTGISLAPAFTSGATTSGKSVPGSGKSPPSGKDELVRSNQTRDQAPSLLAGFTEAGGLEDSGTSFDHVGASAAFTQAAGESAPQAQSGATFALDLSAADAAIDTTLPDLLPESATAMLDSDHTMGSDAWVEDTATQLSLLHEQGLEKAHIRLHPEELGSLDVSITVNDGQAYIQFVTSTPEARELLENSMPSLRELLQQSGLALAEGNVSQGDTRNGQGFENGAQQQRFVNVPEIQPQATNWLRPAQQSRSQVDYYI